MEKREILFRGWNKKNKKWLYGYYFAYRGYHFILSLIHISEPTRRS